MRSRPTTKLLPALAVTLALPAALLAQSAQTYYIPMPSTQVKLWEDTQTNLPEADTQRVVIGITSTAQDAILYWDHWEDGFEFDITNPVNPTPGGGVEIWGDDDCSNGYRPDLGSCTVGVDDANDHFDAGDVLVIQSDVPVPGDPPVRTPSDSCAGNPENACFDGGDKLFASDLLALTYASWPAFLPPGGGVEAQIGDAVEVFSVLNWGSFYVSPIGQNFAGTGSAAFEYVALSIMAREEGTRVDVDVNGPAGGGVVSYTLDEGESVLVTGIQIGATVTASAANGVGTRTVQVDVMTANNGSTYEGRWYYLPPRDAWGQSYYAPAGTTDGSNPARVYVYNPNASTLTVTWERLVGGTFTSSTFNVGTNAVAVQTLPTGTSPVSAAHFYTTAANAQFYAITAIAPGSTIYDWGHALVPEAKLTPAAAVGWAPGATDNSEDTNHIWVTPVFANGNGSSQTDIYVDADGDPTTGALVDAQGNRYDVLCGDPAPSVGVRYLQSLRVYVDGPGTPAVTPGGCSGTTCTFPASSCVVPASLAPTQQNDQTGMRIYTLDGTRLAAAWGQDVEHADSNQPQQLDMGTTVVPFSSLNAFKSGTLLVDLNNNGGLDVNDTLLYTTVIRNTGIIPVTLVRVTDDLDDGTAYVPGTFEIDGLPVADDGGADPFPLDTDTYVDGFVLVDTPPQDGADAPFYTAPLAPGAIITLTYQVRILATATNPIVNRVTVASQNETFVDTATNPIPASILQVAKTSSVNPNDAIPGQPITYSVTVTNGSTTAGVTGVRLVDQLPAGTTYQVQSTSVTGPRQLFVADRFGTVTPSYNNSNGPNPWDGNGDGTPDPWLETSDGGTSPTAGDAQVIIGPGGGELRLGGGSTVEVRRALDLGDYASGFGMVRFDFRASTTADIGDSIIVDCNDDDAGGYTTLGAIDWIDGDAGGTQITGKFGAVFPAFCMTASHRTRLGVSAGYSGGEFIFIDNIEVRAVDTSTVLATDDFSSPPNGGSGWTGGWVPTGSPNYTGGVVQLNGPGTNDAIERSINLAGSPRPIAAVLTFNLSTSNTLDGNDSLEVQVAEDGSNFVSLARFIDDSAGIRTFDLTDHMAATTAIRFIVTGSTSGGGQYFQIDNVNIIVGTQSNVTKDNNTGGANADLIDGVPSILTLPADSFALAPGESLTATYTVTVDSPTTLSSITNVVEASAHEAVQIVRATVTDPISRGGIIGDRVWLDADGDGVQDVGEPGISGVTVELRNGICTAGVNCPTAVTDLNGNYLFDGLLPGSYEVFVIAGVPAGLGNPPFPPTQPSVITNEEIFLNVDFGYVPNAGTAVLGDRVWADADGDGIQDPGEIGIGGVTVTLLGADSNGLFTIPVATTTTDPDGSYLFTNIAAGTYAVAVSGSPLSGRTPTVGPQSIGAALSPPIALVADQVRTDIDFGYTAPGTYSITDAFWVDEDRDGIFDANERPIPGVTVNLVCAAPLVAPCANVGDVLGTSTSGTDGSFSFSGVPGGGVNYTLVVTDNAGELVGRERTTPDAVAGQRAVTVNAANVSGEHFGYAQPGLIGDRVWSDADGDGLQDPNEPGIGGITVQLLGPGPDGLLFTMDDAVLETQVTAADGSYEFDNLPAGGYQVRIPNPGTQLSGYTQTGDPNYPSGACVVCDSQGSSTLLFSNNTDRNLDFGYRNTARPDVSGTVFLDADRDGFLDTTPPESGIAGVEVALVAAGTDGLFGTSDDLVVATATTDSNGDYLFPDVSAGNYQVEVRDGAGVLDGYHLTSGRDEIPITVAAADITDIDFGYNRTASTGVIGDTLWIDVDPPGADPPDGLPGPTEPRLPGVTVNLYRDLNGNGIIDGPDGAAIQTTVTDVNGQYQFTGLPAGSYLVDVDESTLPDSTPGMPYDLVETTYPPGVNPSRVINLSDGQRYEDADFGYVPRAGTVVLGDFVWFDANGNGLQENGETGIAGIDIQLLDASFNVIATTTTGLDGSYLFTGLAPGTYHVTYDQTDVTGAGLTNQPTNLPLSQRTWSVTTVAGDVLTTLDFGFNGPGFGSIGDQVWLDVDDDGVVDAGEQGLVGVTINLLDDLGNIIGTTVTDSNGQYRFWGLPPGDYRVEVTDIAGITTGLQLTSGTNPTALINLSPGENHLTADFGYVPSGGAGTIGTSVWHDLDFDGTRDPGEPPMAGVTLDLYFDTNGNGAYDPGIDNRVRSVATDAEGNFEFVGLPPGRYFVDPTDRFGVTTGFNLVDGPNDGSDDNSQIDPYTVVLTTGTPNNVTADFGYREVPGGPGSLTISGTTFIDSNVDATYDPNPPDNELPVQSVVVRLYRVLANGSRQLIGVTTSAANGFYQFTDLPDGDYEVRVDPTATAADGFLQTTQTLTGGVQPVPLAGSNSTGNDFGFYQGTVTSTPVTLSFFTAESDGTRIVARWKTSTEVGHVGFQLWVGHGAGWQRAGRDLVPAAGGDTTEIRSYQLEVAGDATEVLLQEVDVRGRSRFHGPFVIGQRYGLEGLANERIAWSAIKAEHQAKVARRAAEARGAALTEGGAEALLVRIEEDGIYRLSYEQLAAAGLDLAGVDAESIALTRKGEPVAIRVEPSSGPFGPGGYVELVGEALDTLYTATNVYRLAVDPVDALRVEVDPKGPGGSTETTYQESMRVERQRAYSFASRTGDPWYDTQVLAFGAPQSASFAFSTSDLDYGPARISVDLWGVTNWPRSPDHHAVVRLNGVPIGEEVYFDGSETVTVTADLPDGYVLPGANALVVELPGDTGVDFDLVQIDGFTVDYPRRLVARDGRLELRAAGESFTATGFPSGDIVVYREVDDRLELLTGGVVSMFGPGSYSITFPGSPDKARYLVASTSTLPAASLDLPRPPSGIASGVAELLVISHPDFLDELAPLVDRRQSQGWNVKVANVEDVYAEFGGDVFDPQAIRDYISFAVANLETRAVLLVGGDTYDYRDYLGYGGFSFLPSLYGPSGDIVRFAPADGLLADVDGDQVPDVSIGRFPVRTSADATALVAKTLEYEDLVGRKSLVLAADGYDAPSRFSFSQTSEELATRIPGDWQVDRVYLDSEAVGDARAALLDALDAGPAVTSYVGHSGPTSWTFDGLFSSADAAGLDNHGAPTVVLQWGCWTSYFVEPANNTLGQKLLLSGDVGAAAVLGASTLTEAQSERALGLQIFQRAFQPGVSLGEAMLEAKRSLAVGGSPAVLDVLLGWNLLGDPTLGLLGAGDGGPLLIFANGFEPGDIPWSAMVP